MCVHGDHKPHRTVFKVGKIKTTWIISCFELNVLKMKSFALFFFFLFHVFLSMFHSYFEFSQAEMPHGRVMHQNVYTNTIYWLVGCMIAAFAL
jgi:hypothetical protein